MNSFCFFMLQCMMILLYTGSYSSASAQMIAPDKQLHLIAGAGISSLSYFTCYKITKKKNLSLLLAFGSGVLAGIAKEVYDAQGYGHPSTMDAVATGVGAFVPCFAFRFTLHKKPKINVNKDPYLVGLNDFVPDSYRINRYTSR
ncbi:MAG: hypothetical protein H0X62_10020 [Bacteroidetes bacterium]|nr:hypothetical protein [Bacteroidota bacterium]